MNKTSTVYLLALALFVSTISATQTKYQLTVQQSIELAVQKGLVASNVTSRYLAAKNRAESARRALWTSVSLSVTAPDFTESLRQQFNPLSASYEYYRLKSTDWQAALNISQPITLTGGTLTLSQYLLRREQTSGLSSSNSTARDYFGDFALELRQPILTSNTHRLARERAELALQDAEADFLNAQLDLVYQVTERFYTLYQQTQRLDIVKEQVKQNEESYTTALSKFSGGLIPEVDVLQSEVDLAASRNDSLNAEREVARARNDFRLLVGIESGDSVAATVDVEYAPITIDVEKALSSALTFRTEALRAERDIQLREIDIAQAKARSDLRVDVTARFGVNKTDSVFRDLFHGYNRSRSAALTLSVPIFDWGSAGMNVEAAEVEYKNANVQRDYVRQQISQETMDLINRIQVAQSRIEVLKKSVGVAQQSYNISQQRFQNGTITRNDLAQAQQRLTTARTNALSALIDYRLGVADLTRKTHWDFHHNSPVEPIIRVEE
ncbi:MAG: TolC family protein [Ignavibacteriae bacterium]|nr:TolC family protein [Ignavibacteriota bacterium]